LINASNAMTLTDDDEKPKSDMKPVQPVPPLPGVTAYDPKHKESDGLVQDI
jgi:hypothetical protein